MKLHALVVAAHPDDAEISLGGTILRLVDAGHAVGVVDLTRGEMGTRGSAEDRQREADAATAQMGLAVRHNLELPDGRVEDTLEAREALARVMREHRPEVVFGMHTTWTTCTPTTQACGRLTRQAWYLSGPRSAWRSSTAVRRPIGRGGSSTSWGTCPSSRPWWSTSARSGNARSS